MNGLSVEIKLLRASLKESQESFARTIKVTIRSVARYEAGSKPGEDVLYRIADTARLAGRLDLCDFFLSQTAGAKGCPVCQAKVENA